MMDREKIARELLKMARELVGAEMDLKLRKGWKLEKVIRTGKRKVSILSASGLTGSSVYMAFDSDGYSLFGGQQFRSLRELERLLSS